MKLSRDTRMMVGLLAATVAGCVVGQRVMGGFRSPILGLAAVMVIAVVIPLAIEAVFS